MWLGWIVLFIVFLEKLMLRSFCFARSLAAVRGCAPTPAVYSTRMFCESTEIDAEKVAEVVEGKGNPTPRRKKRQQVTTSTFKKHFVTKFLRQFVHTKQKLYPVAEVVHLYERRVKFHKRHKEWEENETFKLLRRKERERRHRDVERKYRNWREAKETNNLQKFQAAKELQRDANIQALELLKKTEHLWEFYPDELQDLKYDIRRSHRPYYTRYN